MREFVDSLAGRRAIAPRYWSPIEKEFVNVQ